MQYQFHGPDQPVLTKPEVVTYLRLKSVRALNRLIEQGRFPRGIRTGGPRSPVVWNGADVAAYMHLAGRCQEGPVQPDEDDEDSPPGAG